MNPELLLKKKNDENVEHKEFRAKRVFVLDTNVLLHDSNSIFHFKGVVIVIPFVVLEELDTFKKDQGEIGRNARHIIRSIDELRSQGCLSDGVEITNGSKSILKIVETPKLSENEELIGDLADNLIIKTAQILVEQGFEVTFVTKDINARVKADALGIDAEDYEVESVSTEDFYKGWIKTQVPSNILRQMGLSSIPEILSQNNIQIHNLSANEFIIVTSENNPENYRLFRFLGGKNFKEVENITIASQFSAKNIQQLMALDLLMDDDIKIVSLVGGAGTGKTFLTLLAGLQKVINDRIYRKFLITRPVIALGADIGYLPGEVQEKLRYWMQPVYDNLEYIYSQIDSTVNHDEPENQGKKKDKHKQKKHTKLLSESPVDSLQQKGVLSLEAITYMRGRSIPNQFVFIDEVQNLNPHEVKTIVSRAGEGTKIIIAGDPFQIDSPYLDFSSNGLIVSSAKLKNYSIFGTVFLEKSERSELAKLAAQIL